MTVTSKNLLSLADMPTGWAKSSDTSHTGFSGCKSIYRPMHDAGGIEARLAYGGKLPMIDEMVAVDRNELYQAVSHTLATCHHYTYTSGAQTFGSGAQGFSATVEPVSFPTIGEQSIARIETIDASGLSFGKVDVIVKKDGRVAVFEYADLGSPDMAEVVRLAREAASKL